MGQIMISHVAINVNDMTKTVKFYEDTLGFKKIFELNDPQTGKPWIVYIQVTRGQFLELFYNGVPHTVSDENTGFTHLCFMIDSVEETAMHIEAIGYPLEIKPCRGCDNNLQTWIRDPNGVRIELMQLSSDSPHASYM